MKNSGPILLLAVWLFAPAARMISAEPAAVPEKEVATTIFVENGNPRLIRQLGYAWEFEPGHIEIEGYKSILYAGRAVGEGDFHLRARLTIPTQKDSPTFVASGDGAKLEGFRDERKGYWPTEANRHHHFALSPTWAEAGKPFLFEVVRKSSEVVISAHGKEVHRFIYDGTQFGKVGFCSLTGKLRIHDFSLEGKTAPLNWDRSMPTAFSIPTLDLSGEEHRQVIVDRRKDQYCGHPDTVLLPDQKTMFCTYPLGHGGPAAILKKSNDAGLTWSDRLPVPENWNTATNCPCIFYVSGPNGKRRLLVLEGNGDMRQSISEDVGLTWTPLGPNGLRCIVVPNRLLPISRQRYLALYVDPDPRRPGGHLIAQSITSDGGLSWEKQRVVARHPDALPDEPGTITSPDGKQIAAVMREQSRAYNSLLMTSDDEGQTWTPLREANAAVTGDRHNLRYAPDGRLVAVFRDLCFTSPTKGNFVAWVGTYDDLVKGREGQYRLLLLRQHENFGDCGYAGLEVLPDGTFIATTYVRYRPGELNSVVSVRFQLQELDRRAWGLSH